MEKSQKRGVRRWRSFSKWMTRLKRDWNDHGWGRGLDGRYNCDCFYLNHPQALRFKDTPAGCSCSGCGNPRKWQDGRSSAALTLAERTVDIGDLEFWSKRKRNRNAARLAKVTCSRCGVMTGKIWIKARESFYRKVREMGIDKRCKPCREIMAARIK